MFTIEKKIKALKEEISYKSDVVHHTNLFSLFNILNSEYLLPSSYTVNAFNNKTDIMGSDVREIAVLRRSIDRYIKSLNPAKQVSKLSDLTVNARGVKIYLFSDKILSSLRGVRRKPISEIAKANMADLEKFITLAYNNIKKIDNTIERKSVSAIVKKYGKLISPHLDGLSKRQIEIIGDNNNFFEMYYDKMAKDLNLKLDTKEKRDLFISYIHVPIKIDIIINKNLHLDREGEERFKISKKGSAGIPVNKKYMKIRITIDFTKEDIEDIYDSWDVELMSKRIFAKKFRDLIIKNKDSFLIDKNFDNLLNVLGEVDEK